MDVFVDVFCAVMRCLEIIKCNVGGKWNSDSVRDAGGLFYSTLGFQFIVCLVVISKCLEVTRALTKQLQSSTFDVVASNRNVTLLYVGYVDCEQKSTSTMKNGMNWP